MPVLGVIFFRGESSMSVQALIDKGDCVMQRYFHHQMIFRIYCASRYTP